MQTRARSTLKIPGEMKARAHQGSWRMSFFMRPPLRIFLHMSMKIKDDRAILRAIHFLRRDLPRRARSLDAIGEENYQEIPEADG